ncbi:MAG: amidohydrolase family protein [Thaumarchaeota archaeon]|jgi:5-methylthioadenosine/S-adenosylhomocysteine deaminase|nr:amidohydrolase family protein [Nitrososphaerota archaeon]
MKILFKGKYLLIDYLSEPLKDFSILVEDKKIIKIGKTDELRSEAEEVYDLGNVLVAPSFANTHSHVGMVALRGIGENKTLYDWLKEVWKIESKLDYELLYYANVLGLGEMISSGVTAVLDFYDIPPMVRAVKAIGLPVKVKLGLAFMDKVPYMEEESWKRLKNIKNISAELFNEGFEVFISPHSLYAVSEEMLKELFSINGFKYQMHFAENKEELAEIKKVYNSSPVEILEKIGAIKKWLILAHAVHLEVNELSKLSRNNIFVSHCPFSNSRLASGIAKISEMKRYGIQVSIGTDGAGSSETLNIFNEIRLATLLSRASTMSVNISIKEAMQMASLYGHIALGLNSGEIKPGKNADFITYDLNKIYPSWDLVASLGYQGGPEIVKDVVSDGSFLKKDGKLLFYDLYKESLIKVYEFISSRGEKN